MINNLGNASVYNPYWSVQPIVIVLAYAVTCEHINIVQILMLVAVLLWGIRLTANWAYTFGGLQYQDWRYTMLHDKTGKAYPLINFLGIHLVPTLVVYGCVLPIAFTFAHSNEIVLNTGKIVECALFLAVSIGAATMQSIADCQMHKFRKTKRDRSFATDCGNIRVTPTTLAKYSCGGELRSPSFVWCPNVGIWLQERSQTHCCSFS